MIRIIQVLLRYQFVSERYNLNMKHANIYLSFKVPDKSGSSTRENSTPLRKMSFFFVHHLLDQFILLPVWTPDRSDFAFTNGFAGLLISDLPPNIYRGLLPTHPRATPGNIHRSQSVRRKAHSQSRHWADLQSQSKVWLFLCCLGYSVSKRAQLGADHYKPIFNIN